MRKVYQFGLRPPVEADAVVRDQMRAAREYRNDLVAIERGRRSALRAVDDTDEVREAIALIKAATKNSRKAAISTLRMARKAARDAANEELARIQELDASIRRDARAITRLFWGSYLDIEAAHNQSRSAPIYGDDAITPNDPRFIRWRGVDEGQVGIQIQGGLTTSKVYEATDTRVRIMRAPAANGSLVASGVLWVRVGSDGRAPVWAKWPIAMHREVPDSAMWKWVRVTCSRVGTQERWTCEITVDDPAPMSRSFDASLTGVIAVEWEWTPTDDGGIRVARWVDDRGGDGDVVLSPHNAEGIRKPDGIRSVRDKLLNDMRPKIDRAMHECREPLPPWLARARDTMQFCKSPSRFHEFARRWRQEKCDAARTAYDILQEWEMRDDHLYDYEANARTQALRRRKNFYREIAARWSREYKAAILSDQDLTIAARWGDDSDVRFTAGVAELRMALRNAFGDDAVEARWKDGANEKDNRKWCERSLAAWIAGGARGDDMFAERKDKTINAWAARKARATKKRGAEGTARETVGKCAK